MNSLIILVQSDLPQYPLTVNKQTHPCFNNTRNMLINFDKGLFTLATHNLWSGAPCPMQFKIWGYMKLQHFRCMCLESTIHDVWPNLCFTQGWDRTAGDDVAPGVTVIRDFNFNGKTRWLNIHVPSGAKDTSSWALKNLLAKQGMR